MLRVVALLPLLAACDRVLLGNEIFRDAPPDASEICLRDGFDPPLSNNWDARPTTGLAPFLEGGQLKAPFDTSRTDLIEIRSNELLDFRAGTAQVVNLAAQPTAVLTFTYFAFGIDDKNAYLFAVFPSDGGLRISFAMRQPGVADVNSVIPFDQATFKFWRFVHVPATNMVEFYTSENGEVDNWAKRFETPALVPVDAIRFSIGTTRSFAGGMESAPAVYDDFEVCYPTTRSRS